MIEVGGYKAYHGDMLVNKGTDTEHLIKDCDFIYVPYNDEWICEFGSYASKNCQIYPPRGSGYSVSVFGHCIDPCCYDVVEKHENVTVEVLRCYRCGKQELSWYDPEKIESELGEIL